MTESTQSPENVFATPAGYGAPPAQRQAWSPPAQYAPVVPDEALASPWERLGAALLNMLLILVTLGIGYLIWALVLWGQGTNPGKKICGLRMVKADSGRLCTFGDMLVRNFVMGTLVMWVLGALTFGIAYLVDLFMIFGARRQRLIDKMAGTLVVRG